jgi:hypothetical protein
MSRYSTQIDGNTLAWGYDRPLNEPFIQMLDSEDNSIFELGLQFTTQPHPNFPRKLNWDLEELIGIFEIYQTHIPEEHMAALKKGLPF